MKLINMEPIIKNLSTMKTQFKYDAIEIDGMIKALREAEEVTAAQQPNDPLTLEELREMDGKPVWVEIPNNMVSEWCIAKFDPLMNRVRLWCSGGGWFDGRNVGKSLFVYRRKPKELEGRIEVC